MWQKIKIWAEMIKLEHTIFSAPFMLIAMLWAKTSGSLPTFQELFFCALALLGARSASMSLNRVIDAQIDALNPRTADRAIPKNKIKAWQAILMAIIGFGLMYLAALNLNPICVFLFPLAVFLLSFYSYSKRFTWLCHIILGICISGAALGAWLAIGGQFTSPIIFLACGITFWVAGFDILYALQDLNFDQDKKLFSIPSRFGKQKSLQISAIFHLACFVFFILSGWSLFYFTKQINFTALIIWFSALGMSSQWFFEQHKLIKQNPNQIETIFFTANAKIAFLLFLSVLIGKLFFN